MSRRRAKKLLRNWTRWRRWSSPGGMMDRMAEAERVVWGTRWDPGRQKGEQR